jgi:hypothetical protein
VITEDMQAWRGEGAFGVWARAGALAAMTRASGKAKRDR